MINEKLMRSGPQIRRPHLAMNIPYPRVQSLEQIGVPKHISAAEWTGNPTVPELVSIQIITFSSRYRKCKFQSWAFMMAKKGRQKSLRSHQ